MPIRSKKINNVSMVEKSGLCCGCGLCKPVCRQDSIKIVFDENKRYKPIVSEECINCGLCVKVCPMSVDNIAGRIKRAVLQRSDYGLDNLVSIYKGYEIDEESYIKSASGGMLSAVLRYLLTNKIVDAVIHAEPLYGNDGKKYFKASVSTSAEQVESKRGSFYYPIEFSSVLADIKNDRQIEKVAIVAVPCVLSGIKQLKKYDEQFERKIAYSFALICSHNVTGQFADCLANYFPQATSESKINFRDKNGIENSDDFSNSVEFSNGKRFSDSRFKTPFTKAWRGYAYSWNSCLFCPDFIGEDADACFKDAWGFGDLTRKQGESIAVVKNAEIEKLLRDMKRQGLVDFHEVEADRFKNSQKMTLDYKTNHIDFRVRKHKLLYKNLKKVTDLHGGSFVKRCAYDLDFYLKKLNMRTSKFLSRVLNIPNPAFWFTFISGLSKIVNYTLRFARKLKARYLSKASKAKEKKLEVLYAGGYGYANIGDEAQLSANLSLWKEYVPNSRVTVLSPNPDYTVNAHGNHRVIKASRITFWGFRGVEYGGIRRHRLLQCYFIFRYLQLRANAFFLKYLNFTPFLDIDRAILLAEVKNADVLHIGGGGFLTGKTASRLYDNMGLIRLANYLGTDVILTGHTIGVWQSAFQKIVAKWGLKKVKYIGLRDKTDSINDLKEINRYDNSKVHATFDDALFCKAVEKAELDNYFAANQIDPSQDYLVCNAHYWIIDAARVNKVLSQMAETLDYIKQKYGYNIILLPMHPSDNDALVVMQRMMKEESHIIRYGSNFRLAIAALQNARLCLTMKHHPIVFAMAAGVPTVSIAFEKYYDHKNRGALNLFHQERFSLLVGRNEREMVDKLEILIKERESISREILACLVKYKEQEGAVMRIYLRTCRKIEAVRA